MYFIKADYELKIRQWIKSARTAMTISAQQHHITLDGKTICDAGLTI